MEKNKAEKVRDESGVVILNRVSRAGLTEKVAFEKRHQVQRP